MACQEKKVFIALVLAPTLEGEEVEKKWNYRDVASLSPMWMVRSLAGIIRQTVSA